jgi:2-polyprenyl-3-methyl-5-hydroxy-6-metoxy-1,4-benzoquinol methylase
VNAAAADLARERGLTIVSEDDLAEDRYGIFDAVVLTDVFEHLVEPTAVVGCW